MGVNKLEKKRIGFVTVIGAPNAGKSLLTNKIIGEKISIVSPKVQTTRIGIKAICTEGDCQLVFTDTPGIFLPKRPLESLIVGNAQSYLSSDDHLIVFVVDVKKALSDENKLVLEQIKDIKLPKICVINKVDLIDKERLLPIAKLLGEMEIFSEFFMVSALKNLGVDDLKKRLFSYAKEGEWLFFEDEVSTMPIWFHCTEITREKLFIMLHKELPYSVAVINEKFEDKGGYVNLHQIIIVAKESHKKIVLGDKGSLIKMVGTKARLEIQDLLGKKVNLFLHVKIQEDWNIDSNKISIYTNPLNHDITT